jgi:hypothetical protein
LSRGRVTSALPLCLFQTEIFVIRIYCRQALVGEVVRRVILTQSVSQTSVQDN